MNFSDGWHEWNLVFDGRRKETLDVRRLSYSYKITTDKSGRKVTEKNQTKNQKQGWYLVKDILFIALISLQFISHLIN